MLNFPDWPFMQLGRLSSHVTSNRPNHRQPPYMWLMMASANSEVFTSVASSVRRAKS